MRLNEVNIQGHTFEVGDEYYFREDRFSISQGVYARIGEVERTSGMTLVTFDGFANGHGPDELDIPASRLVEEVDEGAIVEKEYDSQMHD